MKDNDFIDKIINPDGVVVPCTIIYRDFVDIWSNRGYKLVAEDNTEVEGENDGKKNK